MSVFILVHGAMHGGWCWERLVPELERQGHKAVAVDLPGCRNEVSIEQVSLEAYSNAVANAIQSQNEPVILVGHSLGGMSISSAAEIRHERVRHLVYLCAVVPHNGDSTRDLMAKNPDQTVIESFIFSEDGRRFSLRPQDQIRIFYDDCPSEDANRAVARLVPQAVNVLHEPVSVSPQRFGVIPQSYVVCERDRAMAPVAQRMMAGQYDATLYTLDSGHSPFYSRPQQLAALLHDVQSRTRP